MKIIKININDIILDHRNAAKLINKNCFEKETKMVVNGAYLKDNNLIVWLEPVPINFELGVSEYIIAPINDPSEASIIAEVKNRYLYGFKTITFFEINDKLWSIFGKQREKC